MQIELNQTLWSPHDIVEIIRYISWPVSSLLISLIFRNKISSAIKFFFTRNNLSEISVAGASAKFTPNEQTNENIENQSNFSVSSDYKSVLEFQRENETKYTKMLLHNYNLYLNSYGISDEEKIKLTCCALAIAQEVNYYFQINKVIYKSQYQLMELMYKNENKISLPDTTKYFEYSKSQYPTTLNNWDLNQYLSYLLSSQLIKIKDVSYVLTDIGESYIQYMLKYPNLITQLLVS